MNKIILSLILLTFINSGPITAYSACTTCCLGVHATEMIIPFWGLGAMGLCTIEACITPGVCFDPRDSICVFVFYGALSLPTP